VGDQGGDIEDCLCCNVTSGRLSPPGGVIHDTGRWRVDHVLDSLGVGTLIVKPLRHVTSLGALEPDEAAELGPLLQRVAEVVQDLSGAEQVYACLWSHAGGRPTHIHFVVQPITRQQMERYGGYGPYLQQAMFADDAQLDRTAAGAFADQARTRLDLSPPVDP
jgi:diadenosine tetraphosphate (Ap4A) HIT family hydrolase